MVSSLAKALLTPSSVPNKSYTSPAGTPSPIRAISNIAFPNFLIPRLPGNFSISKKSAIVVGGVSNLVLSYAYNVDQTMFPTAQSCKAPGRKSCVAGEPSGAAGNVEWSISSNIPSSQP